MVKRYSIKFKLYNKHFPIIYEKEKKNLEKLGRFDIYHVGSSAVPNMPGKGIIDILILTENQKQKSTLHKRLRLIGYKQGKTKERGRSFFWKIKSGQEYGIHIMLEHNKKASYQILFRDLLINNRKEFRKYLKLKRDCFLKSKGNWEIYKKLKNNYFKEILKILTK